MQDTPFHITARTKRNIRTIILTSLVTTVVGMIYLAFKKNFEGYAFYLGAIDGFIIGFIATIFEVYFFNTVGARWRFLNLFLLRTVFYVILITAAIIFISMWQRSMLQGLGFSEVYATEEYQKYLLDGDFFKDVAFVIVALLLINFIRQINRLLGQNSLLYFITGKYHLPREEKRVVMFLDLKSSTSIAEKLGDKKYHKFLSDFFFDITPAILDSKGEIYQYVGDEVVITWNEKDCISNNECIYCFLRINVAIQIKADKYLKKYGFIPEYKAGLHYGKLIAGEIGDARKEIIFSGDTLNTTARIRSECNNYNKDFLISSELLKAITLNESLTPEFVDKIKLRGKEQEIELYTIKEAL
jgi:adenylate cyclase